MKKTSAQQGAGCASCLFWNNETQFGDEITWGFCRRYPPRSGTDAEGDDVALWPMTVADNWCGEWKASQ
jgi:hypothetical protein